MMGRTDVHSKRETAKEYSKLSRALLTAGCILAAVGLVTALLALTLPYWVSLSETMETTVAGLTDETSVKLHYGLMRFCLVMKATHLDREECGDRYRDKEWEVVTFATLLVSLGLLVVSIATTLVNLRCWNRLPFLVIGTVTSLLAGVSTAVGVSLYQIKSSVIVIDIGGLTTAAFKPHYLGWAFWLGFTSSAASTLGSIGLLLGTFTWKRPKAPRQTYTVRYRTPVRRQHCPYRGREPAVMTISQL